MGPHRSRQSVVSSNKRPRVGTSLPLTAACSGSRFWRALGPPGDQSGDRLGSVGMRGLTPRGKDAPCATDSLPLITRFLLLPLARIETHDAARARGCWRSSHDGQLTVLYCVPTNPGPRSFLAQPIVRLLKPYSNLGPPIFRPPKVHEPAPNISRSRISKTQRVHL
jgi:hypothetical protein